MIMVQN